MAAAALASRGITEALVPANVPPENVTRRPRELHMEILDPRTADVWLHQEPITAAQFAAFRPEAPFIKSGMGHSAMDCAWFRRSPRAGVDGPLETRTVGGLVFARVARPKGFKGLAPGDAPTRLTVEKHHVLGFHAGTTVQLARVPDGSWHVQQTVSAMPLRIAVPAEWEMHALRLSEPWVIEFQSPATVHFFRNLSSFIGPLDGSALPAQPTRCEPAPAV